MTDNKCREFCLVEPYARFAIKTAEHAKASPYIKIKKETGINGNEYESKICRFSYTGL
jgi:hypothetical protein